jgi:hypothetical protein
VSGQGRNDADRSGGKDMDTAPDMVWRYYASKNSQNQQMLNYQYDTDKKKPPVGGQARNSQ